MYLKKLGLVPFLKTILKGFPLEHSEHKTKLKCLNVCCAEKHTKRSSALQTLRHGIRLNHIICAFLLFQTSWLESP